MSEVKTRIIHLEGGQQRQEAQNTGTLAVVYDQPLEPESFRNLFIRNYKTIRRKCTRFSQPGLAIFAVDAYTGEFVGSLCVAAKVDRANSAIIGRHGMTDLYLDGDSSLSLRHLAIVLWPLSNGCEVRFRIVDLRTRVAFQDEHSRRFESMVAEGPIFVRCGSYVLFFLITGDRIAWPDAAKDGWACIPERVYLEAGEAEPDRWQRKRSIRESRHSDSHSSSYDVEEARSAITLVHSAPGPVRARTRLVTAGEEPLGTLRITAESGMQKLIIGPRAAHGGILLGRYSRCDVDGSKILINESISRVHVLIMEIDEHLYAIDTASTHGTWIRTESREVRLIRLSARQELTMGEGLAHLLWYPR
ncbi:MAG: FHA domain-containing protein [Proteobacteria bacterium]|nr:FHA domain-containing protein [Pseudomonadota bacterium]